MDWRISWWLCVGLFSLFLLTAPAQGAEVDSSDRIETHE